MLVGIFLCRWSFGDVGVGKYRDGTLSQVMSYGRHLKIVCLHCIAEYHLAVVLSWNVKRVASMRRKCCLLFSKISFRSGDIQVFKISSYWSWTWSWTQHNKDAFRNTDFIVSHISLLGVFVLGYRSVLIWGPLNNNSRVNFMRWVNFFKFFR